MNNGQIIDYDVIELNSALALGDAVKAQMKLGWQPLGGMAVALIYKSESYRDEDRLSYCQAMVKYAK